MPTQLGRDRHAALGEGGHGDGEALALGAEQGGGRDADVLQDQLGGGLAAQAELAVDRAAGEAGGVRGDEEGGDALVTRGVIGAGEQQDDIGPGAVGDEHLGAVHDVVVAVADRAGGEVSGVGAGARLGEAEAAERLAGGEPGQPRPLLLLGAPGGEGLGDQAEGDGDDAAHGGVAAAEFLGDEAVREVVAARTAVLLRDGEPEEADGAELLDDRPVGLLGAVPRDGVRGDLACDEVLGEPPYGFLLLAQFQIHPVPPQSAI